MKKTSRAGKDMINDTNSFVDTSEKGEDKHTLHAFFDNNDDGMQKFLDTTVRTDSNSIITTCNRTLVVSGE